MRQALVEQIENQIVDAERRCDVKVRAGKFLGGFGGDTGNVLSPVFARSEKKGQNDNASGAAFDAFGVGAGNGRLGQFHVRGFDDIVFFMKTFRKKSGDAFEHLIAFFAF